MPHRTVPAHSRSLLLVLSSLGALVVLPSLVACTGDGGSLDDDEGPTTPDADTPDTGPPACPIDVTARPGTVLTATGAVTGAQDGTLWSWKGIPYAAPPTGPLRWKPPVAAACWSGERPATEYGPRCAQVSPETSEFLGDEDCLTLNVWAPDGAVNAPVMFFIHGGGNTVGTAADPLYDGAQLATRTGSVVVTVQYRLGAFGFFTHAGLNAESAEGISGNYGILDQIAALQWVQANIAGFGGDPTRVLVFGESAGGQNTLVHVASPRSAGLFSRALVESGGAYDTTLDASITALAGVVDAVGCAGAADEVACLRGTSAAELAAVPSALFPTAPGIKYGPVIDGVILPDNPYRMIQRGEHNQVPFAIGSNAQETSRMVPRVSTAQEYAAAVTASYGAALANQLLALYPAASYPSPQAALVKLTTDVIWTCPTRRLARAAAAANQTAPVYRYFFTWRVPGALGVIVGATHGLELPFVFRTFSALGDYAPSAEDLALSDAIQRYWSRFAATGDPNGSGAIVWPRYQSTSDRYLGLDTPITTGDGLSTTQCDAMDAILAGM